LDLEDAIVHIDVIGTPTGIVEQIVEKGRHYAPCAKEDRRNSTNYGYNPKDQLFRYRATKDFFEFFYSPNSKETSRIETSTNDRNRLC